MRRRLLAVLAAFVAVGQLCGADVKEMKERRQRAATVFSDGVCCCCTQKPRPIFSRTVIEKNRLSIT